MTIVFTLCSNNYLAQAKNLGDSLFRHNHEYKFIIGLVDKFHQSIDYTFFKNSTFIPVESLNLADFDSLWKRYNVIELNTCVKASYFKKIKQLYPLVKNIIYLDPDIQVFSSLKSIEEWLTSSDILITPHALTPLPLDGCMPSENIFLNYGIYNLGFIALNATGKEFDEFTSWWESRTLRFGFIDEANGFFVDQLWINLVPIYFKKVNVINHMGYNMAPWNLHERLPLEKRNEEWILQGGEKLIFYHFSSFNVEKPDIISKYYNRYNFDASKNLFDLYCQYYKSMIDNKIHELKIIAPHYNVLRNDYLNKSNTKIIKEQKESFSLFKLIKKLCKVKTSFI
jgi:hypothetical protein